MDLSKKQWVEIGLILLPIFLSITLSNYYSYNQTYQNESLFDTHTDYVVIKQLLQQEGIYNIKDDWQISDLIDCENTKLQVIDDINIIEPKSFCNYFGYTNKDNKTNLSALAYIQYLSSQKYTTIKSSDNYGALGSALNEFRQKITYKKLVSTQRDFFANLSFLFAVLLALVIVLNFTKSKK